MEYHSSGGFQLISLFLSAQESFNFFLRRKRWLCPKLCTGKSSSSIGKPCRLPKILCFHKGFGKHTCEGIASSSWIYCINLEWRDNFIIFFPIQI